MKLIKRLFLLLIVVAAIGYGAYYVLTEAASEKIVEQTAGGLKESGQLEEVKSYVESNPQLQSYIEEAKNADAEQLPFQTTGEATRVLIQKVGVAELKKMESGMRSGEISQEEAIKTLEEKLTEEELLALKVIAYKELYE